MSATIGSMDSLTRGSPSGSMQPAGAKLVGVDERHSFGQRQRILAALVGSLEDLVVHVGDVAHVSDPVAQGPEEANDDVERDEGAGVPGVGVIHYVVSPERRDARGPARARLRGGLEPLGHRVVEAGGAPSAWEGPFHGRRGRFDTRADAAARDYLGLGSCPCPRPERSRLCGSRRWRSRWSASASRLASRSPAGLRPRRPPSTTACCARAASPCGSAPSRRLASHRGRRRRILAFRDEGARKRLGAPQRALRGPGRRRAADGPDRAHSSWGPPGASSRRAGHRPLRSARGPPHAAPGKARRRADAVRHLRDEEGRLPLRPRIRRAAGPVRRRGRRFRALRRGASAKKTQKKKQKGPPGGMSRPKATSSRGPDPPPDSMPSLPPGRISNLPPPPEVQSIYKQWSGQIASFVQSMGHVGMLTTRSLGSITKRRPRWRSPRPSVRSNRWGCARSGSSP